MEARGVHNTNLIWVHHSICKAQWNKYYKRCPFNKIESHNFLLVDIKNSVIHCIFSYIHSISMIFSIANKFYLYNKIHWIMNFRTFNPLRNLNIWLYWCFQLEAKKKRDFGSLSQKNFRNSEWNKANIYMRINGNSQQKCWMW